LQIRLGEVPHDSFSRELGQSINAVY